MQEITQIDQIEVGKLYRCYNNSHDHSPFNSAPFRVLSVPFWAESSFSGDRCLHIVVEVEGYNGPTGRWSFSAQGQPIGLLCERFNVEVRAQAVPLARLGVPDGVVLCRDNSLYLVTEEANE